jgi:hypothetical protein
VLGEFTVFGCGTSERCEQQAVLWSAQFPTVAKRAIAVQYGKEVLGLEHE